MKTGEPAVKAFLNSNPPLKGETLTDPHGRTISMDNTPFVEVMIEGIKDEKYEIFLQAGQLAAKKEARGKNNIIRAFFTDPILASHKPKKAEINLKGGDIELTRSLPLSTHTVSGRALDFSGKPLQPYLWATQGDFMSQEIITKADEKGYFRIECPRGKKLWLFVGDKTYGKTSLEGWVTGPDLQNDIKIPEIKIGDFEVYDLKTWFSAGVWHVFFIPARVDMDTPPELEKKDIQVWIDGKPGEISHMTPHLIGGDYPSYLLCVEGGEWETGKTQLVRVRVDRGEKGKGEAWCIDY